MHHVSPEEITEIKKLGFKFHTSADKSPDAFINSHFPGLNLLVFLNEVHNVLKPVANADLNKHVNYNEGIPPTLTIRYYSDNYNDEKFGLLFARTFFREIAELSVSHDYLVLPEASRGKKIGKRVLAACLEQYISMQVDKIKIHAGLQDGGYVWAKAGFKAIDKVEIDMILKQAELQLRADEYDIVKAWYNDYYDNNTLGTAFNIEDWARLHYMKKILKGSDWHGEIDLTNQNELINFKNYVSG